MPDPVNPQLPNAAELTPQQIADEIARQQTGGEPSQPDGREYVYQTESGSVFRGRTKQEVIDTMLKSQDHANRLIKQQRDELEQAKAILEQQTPYVQQAQQQPQQFNSQGYYEGWARDPVNAELTLLDYALQQRYGMSLDDFAQQSQQAYQFAAVTSPKVLAMEWMASTPTYPNFERAGPELGEKAANAISALYNEFYPNEDERGITPQRLEQLHAVALMRGMYQAAPPAPPAVESSAQSQPMPTLNAGTSGGTGQQTDYNRMTPEQLRALFPQ